MGHGPSPFTNNRLLVFKPWVPRRLRFWLLVMFALFYQFSGGIYLAALSQMVGELSFISADVTMASYCSLIGLNMIFPMLFRWKFYFFSRQMWFVSSIGSIICAILAPMATIPWVLWLICLIAGYFKMMGMFGCMSTIQLNITPTRNYGVFFPVVYLLVCGSIQLSGLITAYITYEYNWRYVYLLVIGMMLIIDAVTYFMMNHDHRSAPFIPLKGIDWLGHILWVASCVVAAWIFNFGEHYDWWDSHEIWTATWIFIAVFGSALCVSHFKREPYMSLKAFDYQETWRVLFILMTFAILHASAHVLQPVFMNAVAGYDYYTIVRFNYPEIYGIIMGAVFTYFTLVRWQWRAKTFFFTAFILAVFYLMSSYFLIDPSTEAWMFYVPLFAFGVAEVMIESGATYMVCRNIPFHHAFMNIAIIGLVRCGVGTAAASAIVERLFAWSLDKNMMLTASEPTPLLGPLPEWMSGYIAQQNVMLAVKESLGWLILFGIVIALLILTAKYTPTLPRIMPKMGAAARWIRTSGKTPDPTIE